MAEHGRTFAVRALIALLIGSAAWAAMTGAVDAHAADESYVYLDVGDRGLSGQIELAYVDLEQVFAIDLGDVEAADRAVLAANGDAIVEYTAERFAIGDGETDWAVRFDGVLTLGEAYDDVGTSTHAVLPFEVDIGDQPVPQVLTVRFEPFFDVVDGRNALLLVSNDWRRGVFDNESEALVTFDAGTRTRSVDLGAASEWRNFRESIGLGMDHIETGPDHIFFVLVLLLPSVLVWRASRWWPAETFGRSLWRVLKIVTMFTIAHSITFTLAGLDILPLPPGRFVESVIAASIVAAALHNLRPLRADGEWIIAFAFGLFHGMGFASLVSDLDVGRSTQLVSLLGRNVGIEIGQAFIVLVVFPGLFLLRRTTLYRPFFVGSSVVLAVVSLGWFVERAIDVEIGVLELVDKLLRFPRVMIAVIAFDVACAVVHWHQRRAGRLLAPGVPEPSEAIDDPEPAAVST